jgi:hypothetical protein
MIMTDLVCGRPPWETYEKLLGRTLTLSSRSGDDSIAEDLHLTSLGSYRTKFSWFAQKNNMFWCQPTEILT